MLNTLIRIIVGVFGIAMLLETFLPQSRETTTVDRHTITTRTDRSNQWRNTSETDYIIHFHGSKIESCDLGFSAYNAIQDGDTVWVRYSKLFKRCTGITKSGVTVYDYRGWRWMYASAGLFMLLGALGVFPSFNVMGREVT
jgi:hypothetical protein